MGTEPGSARGAAEGRDSPPLGAAGKNPSPNLVQIPPQSSQPKLLLFQAQPCVSVYLQCVPAEPRPPHTSCLHISCKFEFDLVGWSPGGLLDAFERVLLGLKRSAVSGDVWSRRGAERGSVGRRAGGKRKGEGDEKGGDNGGIPESRGMAPSTQLAAHTAPSSHICCLQFFLENASV